MAGRIILETERLWLREFDLDDAEVYYRLGRDPDIIRYTGDPGLTSLDEARESMLARPLADYAKYGYGRLAVVFKATSEVIGFSGLKLVPDQNEVDFGYRFVPEYWGQGLATESGRTVIPYGFEQLGLTKLIGLVDPANTRSHRVLTKLGFTSIGEVIFRGDPCIKYELTAEAYKSRVT
jgi:[ribosomal protein S5]-alanine N-acetyltransferase